MEMLPSIRQLPKLINHLENNPDEHFRADAVMKMLDASSASVWRWILTGRTPTRPTVAVKPPGERST